jgi:hypothetical protein
MDDPPVGVRHRETALDQPGHHRVQPDTASWIARSIGDGRLPRRQQ